MVRSTEKAYPDSVAKHNQRLQQYIGQMDQNVGKYRNCVHSGKWWLPCRRSVANADQPMDLLHFRRKCSHVCFMGQAPCRVTRQHDGHPKGLEQHVPDEVHYDSMDHIIMGYGSYQHGVWITSSWSILIRFVVWAQDVVGRPTTGVTSVTLCGPRMWWEGQLQV